MRFPGAADTGKLISAVDGRWNAYRYRRRLQLLIAGPGGCQGLLNGLGGFLLQPGAPTPRNGAVHDEQVTARLKEALASGSVHVALSHLATRRPNVSRCTMRTVTHNVPVARMRLCRPYPPGSDKCTVADAQTIAGYGTLAAAMPRRATPAPGWPPRRLADQRDHDVDSAR